MHLHTHCTRPRASAFASALVRNGLRSPNHVPLRHRHRCRHLHRRRCRCHHIKLARDSHSVRPRIQFIALTPLRRLAFRHVRAMAEDERRTKGYHHHHDDEDDDSDERVLQMRGVPVPQAANVHFRCSQSAHFAIVSTTLLAVSMKRHLNTRERSACTPFVRAFRGIICERRHTPATHTQHTIHTEPEHRARGERAMRVWITYKYHTHTYTHVTHEGG